MVGEGKQKNQTSRLYHIEATGWDFHETERNTVLICSTLDVFTNYRLQQGASENLNDLPKITQFIRGRVQR